MTTAEQKLERALFAQEVKWKIAVRGIERAYATKGFHLSESGRVYSVMTWNGSGTAEGGKIGDTDIRDAREGVLWDAKRNMLAAYSRLESGGGLMGDRHKILLYTDGQTVTPPPGGHVEVLAGKPAIELPHFMQPELENNAALSPDERVWKMAIKEIVQLRSRHSAAPLDMKFDMLMWQGDDTTHPGNPVLKGLKIGQWDVTDMADSYSSHGLVLGDRGTTLGQFVRLEIYGGPKDDRHIVLLATRDKYKVVTPRRVRIEHLGKRLSLEVPALFARRDLDEPDSLMKSAFTAAASLPAMVKTGLASAFAISVATIRGIREGIQHYRNNNIKPPSLDG